MKKIAMTMTIVALVLGLVAFRSPVRNVGTKMFSLHYVEFMFEHQTKEECLVEASRRYFQVVGESDDKTEYEFLRKEDSIDYHLFMKFNFNGTLQELVWTDKEEFVRPLTTEMMEMDFSQAKLDNVTGLNRQNSEKVNLTCLLSINAQTHQVYIAVKKLK